MSTAVASAVGLLIGIVIFVGLPLVAWGVTDVQAFVSHPARLGYIVLVVLLQVLVVIWIPSVGRSRSTGRDMVLRQRVILVLIQVLSLAIVIVAPYGDCRDLAVLGDVEMVRYVGLGLFSLGFAAMHWAEASLDRQFSVEVTIQEDHRLVTDGPYRVLRHPRYLGITVFTTGISLVYRSWLGLILVAALTAVLIWRIQDEEKLMHQAFGADWEAYCQRSWRLIPFVY